MESGDGCQPCLCNMTGAMTSQCDDYTGQCLCHPTMTGRTCDRCLPGYFGFSSQGCRVCDQCDIPGHICHPRTGRCVCPPRTEGRRCERCTYDAWGYNPLDGCRPCDCSSGGSLATHCDLHTGQCMCLDNYIGQRCDQCRRGYFGYPACQSCQCSVAGTVLEKCGNTRGQCECRDDGQCPCKGNVYERRCASCIPGTFSMRADNPTGCTSCFCFHRSTQCHQAPYVWSKVCVTYQCHQARYVWSKVCVTYKCHQARYVWSKVCVTYQCHQARYVWSKVCVTYQCHKAPYMWFKVCVTFCQCHQAPYMWFKVCVAFCQCHQAPYMWSKVCVTFCQCHQSPYTWSKVCVTCLCHQAPYVLSKVCITFCQCHQAPYMWSKVCVTCPCHQAPYVLSKVCITFCQCHQTPYMWFKVCVTFCQCHQSPYTWSKVCVTCLCHQAPYVLSKVRVTFCQCHQALYVLSKTLSYNGKMTFKVAREVAGGSATSAAPNTTQHPLVVLMGNYKLRLSSEITEPVTSGHVHEFSMRLREDLWRDSAGQPASRELLMVALQNVNNWLLKASDSLDVAEVHLLGVTLEQAVPASGRPPTAFGVEQCTCPREYTGLSCQDPALGYYRSHLKMVVDINLDPMDLVGRIYPSLVLRVMAQQVSFVMPVTRVTLETIVREGTRSNGACDRYTGLCDCHPGVTGRHCDVCQPRYALSNGACISCYEGCPGILMTALDDNERALSSVHLSSQALPPWKHLTDMQDHISEYRELLWLLPSRHSVDSLPDSTQLRAKAATLTRRARVLRRRGPKLERSSGDTHRKATDLFRDVSRVTSTINVEPRYNEVVGVHDFGPRCMRGALGLPRLIGGIVSRRLDGGVWDISDALEKVKVVMEVIKNKNFSLESENTEDSLREAKQLVDKLQLMILQHTLDPSTARSRLNQTLARLTDLDHQLARTQKTLRTTERKNSRNRHNLDEMRQSTKLFHTRLYSVADRIQEAAQFNDDAAFLLWNISSINYKARAELIAQLPAKAQNMEERVSTFEHDLPQVEPLVRDSERHATQLDDQYNELDTLISGTRNMAADPLRAATAYRDMAAAIFDAQDAASEASAAVRNVSQKVRFSALRK
ncbi:hypothetical protein LSAT2_029158 [Lamellibrachia satsuma]|nr:hypothetical protein LSAT2_029158 [Lamellibrachia satsuma]